MSFYKYLRKVTSRIDNFLSETTKDFIYRNFGFFPPNPPKIVTLGEVNSKYTKLIDGLETVCLFMGPNRNLTTLTASVLALHPNCQVMSHGGQRVLPTPLLNFLDGYNDEKFKNFCHFALVMSQTGGKGGLGGSITITHPFRHHKIIRNAYRKRYGRSLIKKDIKCLVWKEAHLVDDFVRLNGVDLPSILRENSKLRLVLPIRNPLHVARSFFVNNGFRERFYGQFSTGDFNPFLNDVLERIKSTVQVFEKCPEQVMIFFEDDIKPELMVKFASFLRVPVDEKWIKDSVKCFEVKKPEYQFTRETISYFESQISELFDFSPDVGQKLCQYLPTK